jgi:Lrp/AsnC family leucine-responsive transcriptional regulator
MQGRIDSVDLQILNLVQSDARLANAEVARNLGMAPSAIHQRLKRLEERGILLGYSARIDPRAIDRGLLSFIHVSTDEQLGCFDAATAIAQLPGVLEVHDIAGDDCYLLKVRSADTADLHRFLREQLGAVPGVRSTRTTIVLKTISERVDLPIPVASEIN